MSTAKSITVIIIAEAIVSLVMWYKMLMINYSYTVGMSVLDAKATDYGGLSATVRDRYTRDRRNVILGGGLSAIFLLILGGLIMAYDLNTLANIILFIESGVVSVLVFVLGLMYLLSGRH